MKTFNRNLISSLIMGSLIALPFAAFAQEAKEFTIINHFDQTLKYTVGINPQTVPDLPTTFQLSSGDSIKTRILEQKEAYIRVEDNSSPKPKSAFWGVELVNNQVKFHGYIGKGIAYSWKAQTITFCTPEEYKKNRSC